MEPFTETPSWNAMSHSWHNNYNVQYRELNPGLPGERRTLYHKTIDSLFIVMAKSVNIMIKGGSYPFPPMVSSI